MSDELFAVSVTVGFLTALLLWVPALNLIQRFIRDGGEHTHKG